MRLAGSLALLACLSTHAAVIESFDTAGTWYIHDGAKRGGAFELSDGAGKITWQPTHAPFIECHLGRHVAIPELATALTGTLAVDLQTASPAMVKDLSLRLIDANNEVFQFAQKLDLPANSWHTVRYELKPENIRDSWGTAKDGKLDFPLRLVGFALSFTADATAAGSLLIDNVRMLTPGRQVPIETPLWRFDSRERWSFHEVGKGTIALTPGANGLAIALQPVAKTLGIPLYESKFGTIGEPRPMVLAAELKSGGAVGFIVRIRDRDGEVFQSPVARLQPGANRLTVDLAKPQKGSWGDNQNGVVDSPVRLHELFLVRDASTEPATVMLAGAWLAGTQPALETITADLVTENPIHVLRIDSDEHPVLRLTTGSLEPLEVGLTVRLEGYNRWLDPLTRQVSIPARGSVDVPLPRPAEQGIWWTHLTLDDGAGAERSMERSFCVMDPAGPTPGRGEGFLFSICTHTERWPEDDQVKEVLAAGMCGAKVIRTGPGWPTNQPEPGRFDWTRLDRIMEMYESQGMELQLLLGFTPRWAAKQDQLGAADWRDWGMNAPADMDAWERYCGAIAERYKDRVRFWEVWNEPDISFWRGTLPEYLDLLKRANRAINAVDPKLEVMTGGFAAYFRNPEFVEAVVVGAQSDYDILAWHRHGEFDSFRQEVDGPVAAMRAKLNPPKPIYFNETAMHSTGGREKYQAEQLVKKLTFTWARGAIGYTWYDLRNDGFDPTDAEHNYGMVTNDFYPKAVYPTYNTLAKHLTGKQFGQQLDLGPNRWAFSFTGGGETIVAAWDESRGGQQVIVATDARSAARMDMMGNQTPIDVLAGGRVILDCRAEPGYLVLQGATKPLEVLGSLASVTPPAVLKPGESAPVAVTFRNPLAQPMRLSLAWDLPQGWTGPGTTMELAAGAESRAVLQLTAPATAGPQPTLRLRYNAVGQPFSGTVEVPLRVAKVVAAGQPEPAWTLNQPAQVHEMFQADPNKKHLLWQGPADLGAEVYLNASATDLTVRVAVTDDTHRQPHVAAAMWQADSIQFALFGPKQTGFWEFGMAQADGGQPLTASWHSPDGRQPGEVTLQPRIQKTATGLTYEVALPLARLGLTRADLAAGIGFSLIVNDDDGEGRESWIEVSKGIGESKDRTLFPMVVLP